MPKVVIEPAMILGMTETEYLIFEYFLKNRIKESNTSIISSAVNKHRTNILDSLRILENKKILRSKKIGSKKVYILNKEYLKFIIENRIIDLIGYMKILDDFKGLNSKIEEERFENCFVLNLLKKQYPTTYKRIMSTPSPSFSKVLEETNKYV